MNKNVPTDWRPTGAAPPPEESKYELNYDEGKGKAAPPVGSPGVHFSSGGYVDHSGSAGSGGYGVAGGHLQPGAESALAYTGNMKHTAANLGTPGSAKQPDHQLALPGGAEGAKGFSGNVKMTAAKLGDPGAPQGGGSALAYTGNMKHTAANLGQPGAPQQPGSGGYMDAPAVAFTGNMKHTAANLGQPGVVQQPGQTAANLNPPQQQHNALAYSGHMKQTAFKLGDPGGTKVPPGQDGALALTGNIKQTAFNLGSPGGPPGSGGGYGMGAQLEAPKNYGGNMKITVDNLHHGGPQNQNALGNLPPPFQNGPPFQSGPGSSPFQSGPTGMQETLKLATDVKGSCNPRLIHCSNDQFSIQLPSVKVTLDTTCTPPPSFTQAGLIPLRPHETADVKINEEIFMYIGQSRDITASGRSELMELPPYVNMETRVDSEEQFGEVCLDIVDDVGRTRTKVGANVLKYSIFVNAIGAVRWGAGNMGSNRFDVDYHVTIKLKLERRQGADFQHNQFAGPPMAAPQIRIVAPSPTPQNFPVVVHTPPSNMGMSGGGVVHNPPTNMGPNGGGGVHNPPINITRSEDGVVQNPPTNMGPSGGVSSNPFNDRKIPMLGPNPQQVAMQQQQQFAMQQQQIAMQQQQYAAQYAHQQLQQRAMQQRQMQQQAMLQQQGESARQMQAFEVETPQKQAAQEGGGCPCCSIS